MKEHLDVLFQTRKFATSSPKERSEVDVTAHSDNLLLRVVGKLQLENAYLTEALAKKDVTIEALHEKCLILLGSQQSDTIQEFIKPIEPTIDLTPNLNQ